MFVFYHSFARTGEFFCVIAEDTLKLAERSGLEHRKRRHLKKHKNKDAALERGILVWLDMYMDVQSLG